MKLTRLNIQNVLGVRAVDIKLTTPVTIFAGLNYSGKSSLQEAVRMALTGETMRGVELKKDYGKLLTEGATVGFAEAEIDGMTRAFMILPQGETTPLTKYVPPVALPYVLDAQRFARLDSNERRAFIFGLMGLSAGAAEVKQSLLEKGCNEQKVETILPMLSTGFDAGCNEAQAMARQEKVAWRMFTGETYGEKKAETWAAEKPAFDASALADLQQRLATVDADLETANQRVGALEADRRRQIEIAQRRTALREKHGRKAQVAEKLLRVEADLKVLEAKVTALKGTAQAQNALPCPACGVMLTFKDGELVHHAAPPTAEGAEDPAKLPEYEKALRLMQTTVANDKRVLADAEAVAKTIAELEAAVGVAPSEAEVQAALQQLGELKHLRSDIAAKVEAQKNAERQSNQAVQRTAKAHEAHQSTLAWLQIADALAPDGIPGEMLAEALTPINDRLTHSADIAEWTHVEVTQDMQVLAGGRAYALLSESERWRTDAMLAEAVAHISGIKLLLLDRIDVLDLQGREDLIAWLEILAQEGEIQTALISGTLKTLPTELPQTFAAYWLENGIVAQNGS